MTNNEEFAKLGQAIGDAVNRLPSDRMMVIALKRNDISLFMFSPGAGKVFDGIPGQPLADEIAKAVDAAIEHEKRRVSDE